MDVPDSLSAPSTQSSSLSINNRPRKRRRAELDPTMAHSHNTGHDHRTGRSRRQCDSRTNIRHSTTTTRSRRREQRERRERRRRRELNNLTQENERLQQSVRDMNAVALSGEASSRRKLTALCHEMSMTMNDIVELMENDEAKMQSAEDDENDEITDDIPDDSGLSLRRIRAVKW